MNEEKRKSIIIKRLTGELNGSNKEICDCDYPAPYQPKGICAPMYPINHCLVCGGFYKNSADVSGEIK